MLSFSKLTELVELVNSVHEDRGFRFHFEFNSAVEETASSYRNDDTECMSSEMAHDPNFGKYHLVLRFKVPMTVLFMRLLLYDQVEFITHFRFGFVGFA